MAQPGTEGDQGAGAPGSADDVVRPGTGVVRPGTGVVRPGTGVVRPGTASPDGTAKAVAAVPETPEKPLEPIHVVLPVIPVKPAKQGFLDRLVAGKSEAEKAAEKAAEDARREEEARRKAEEERRKAEEERRKAEEKAAKEAEKARRAQEEAQRKAEEKAAKEAEKARREREEAEEKARAKAEEKAAKEAERARREREEAKERARRAEERALRRAREEDDEDDDEPYNDGRPRDLAGPATAPRPAPAPPPPTRAPTGPPRPPQAPPAPPLGPPRPAPRPAPPRPAPPPARSGRMPDRRPDRYDDRYDRADREPARRPWWHWAVAAGAALVLGSGSAAITGALAPEGTVAYHVGVDTGQRAPMLAQLDESAAQPSRAGLDAALGPLFADAGLGPSVAGAVLDAETGELLWDRRGNEAMTPASTAKLLTAAAVLATRGPNYRIPTRVLAGASPGDVVLVGGGDPTLALGETSAYRGAARLDQLAEQVRAALGGTTPTRVLYDSSLFTGPTVHPSWAGADINNGVISSITALMTDGARVNPTDTRSSPQHHEKPDEAAARLFAQALGVPDSQVLPVVAPQGGRVLGEVFSPPLARIVERMLLDSDNVVAEVLARQAALARGLPASFDGAAQATNAVLAELGVPVPPGVSLVDGSGLSDDNRVTANQVAALLQVATSPEHPELSALLSGLPVAGYSGTMGDRGGAGVGVVRAKTGTLSHVNSLAGYAVDADGRMLVFAVLADATSSEWAAENALDRIAAAISGCGCR